MMTMMMRTPRPRRRGVEASAALRGREGKRREKQTLRATRPPEPAKGAHSLSSPPDASGSAPVRTVPSVGERAGLHVQDARGAAVRAGEHSRLHTHTHVLTQCARVTQAYVALEHHFAAAAVQQAPQVMMGWMPGGAAAPPWAPPQAVPPLGGPPSWGPQHAPPPPPHMVPLTSSSSWYPEQAVAAAPVMPPMVYGQHVASVIPSAPHTAPPHMLAHPMYGQPATHGDGSALLVPAMPVGHGGADGAWAPPTLGALMPPSLATLLADLAHSVAAPGTAAPLAPSSGHDAPAAAAPATPETRLEFDAQAMRGAANQRAIAAMYGDQPLQCPTTGRRFRDAVSYAAHLEVQALQQRKEQEGKQLSRRWFVPFDTWASGAAAVGADPDAAGAFFDEQEAAAAAKAAEAAKAAALSLPVDESQPRCALTGELFETFWHAELEEWHYRGAVRLDKPTGGVPAGRLVLAKAVPTLQGDAAKALLDSHAVALDLAAAAAAAGAEEMLPPPYAADAQPARERGGDGEATSGGGVDGEPADEHGAKRQRTGE